MNFDKGTLERYKEELVMVMISKPVNTGFYSYRFIDVGNDSGIVYYKDNDTGVEDWGKWFVAINNDKVITTVYNKLGHLLFNDVHRLFKK